MSPEKQVLKINLQLHPPNSPLTVQYQSYLIYTILACVDKIAIILVLTLYLQRILLKAFYQNHSLEYNYHIQLDQ